MVEQINLEVEERLRDVTFIFALPELLDEKLRDYAYRESVRIGKRISKADICRNALLHFFECVHNEQRKTNSSA